eukprot:3828894-Amphidinium_carterae.1
MTTTMMMGLVFPLVVGTEHTSPLMDGTVRMMLGCATESNRALQHHQVLQVEVTILDVIRQVSLASLTSSVNP